MKTLFIFLITLFLVSCNSVPYETPKYQVTYNLVAMGNHAPITVQYVDENGYTLKSEFTSHWSYSMKIPNDQYMMVICPIIPPLSIDSDSVSVAATVTAKSSTIYSKTSFQQVSFSGTINNH